MHTAKVYTDPLTRQDLEGRAHVHSLKPQHVADPKGLRRAWVRFGGSGEPEVYRLIWEDDITERGATG